MTMISSTLLFFLSPIFILIYHATAQPDFLYYKCLESLGSQVTTMLTVPIRQTSTFSSPPYPQTLKLKMAFSLTPMAKTLTKFRTLFDSMRSEAAYQVVLSNLQREPQSLWTSSQYMSLCSALLVCWIKIAVIV